MRPVSNALKRREARRRSCRATIGRRIKALPVLVAVMMASAGCATRTSMNQFARAVSASSHSLGYRMTMTFRVKRSQPSIQLDGSGAGTFDTKDHIGTMLLSVHQAGGDSYLQQAFGRGVPVHLLFDHSTLYVRAAAGPGTTPWLKFDLAKVGGVGALPGLTGVFGNPAAGDPSQILGDLRAVTGRIERIGVRRLRGVQTTEYRASVALGRVAANVPPGSREAIRRGVEQLEQRGVRSIPVEVWVDLKGLVRQVHMAYGWQHTGATRFHAVIRVDILAYGRQPRPSLPSPAQVTDATTGIIGAPR